MATTVLVYRGRDNQVELQLTRYNEPQRKLVPIDFSAVTRMVLVFSTVDPVIAFDTASTAGVIDWSRGQGWVVFNISQYALPVGEYAGQLVAYSPAPPNGEVVFDHAVGDRDVTFDVREVLATGSLPPPLPSGGEATMRVAGETLSALKAIYELNGLVYALDAQDTAHAAAYLGLTTTSGNAGSEVVVQRSGTLDDASWAWTPGGEVFVGVAGSLTQTAPTTGVKLVVGTAASAMRINLTFDTPVYL
jgi:hypothetical protein